MKPIYPLSCALVLLSGCKTVDRVLSTNETPPLTHIQNPHEAANYQAVTMPMPTPEIPQKQTNSLWRAGARTFFKDQRASRVGDILTVQIDMNDTATMNNTTKRTRNSSENIAMPKFLGFEQTLGGVLPKGVDPTALVNASSNPSHEGKGSISRSESVKMSVAVIVTQILPNGNFVIEGRQEVRVNYEVRDLVLKGIVRPEDVTSTNTVSHEKISDLRMSYGGRGQLDDVQQPPWGHQIADAISPF